MKIEVHNVRSNIVEFPPDSQKKALLKAFTKKAKNAFWAQKSVKGWNGSTMFISAKKGMFPTGLLEIILIWCDKNNVEVELDDQRICPTPKGPKFDPDMLTGITLREDQSNAVKACLKADRGLIKASTGSGKTETVIALTKSLGLKTMIIVERANLATQTRKRFYKRGFKRTDVGIVGDKYNQQNRQIVITMVQSSHKITNLEEYDVVLVDESHHSKAKTYITLLKKLTNAYYRFGFSGTTFGDDPVDDMYRISQFGNILCEISTQTLIEEGVLSRPIIRFIEINQPQLNFLNGYWDIYKAGIVRNNTRNNLIMKFARGFRGKTVILFKVIEHGQELKRLLPGALYIDGDIEPFMRDKILDGFSKVDEGILVASTVIDEGINFSNVANLIISGADKSPIKTIQRLGRGLRKNDMMIVNVIEFFDKTNNMLERHARKRMKVYKEEGHEIKIFTT